MDQNKKLKKLSALAKNKPEQNELTIWNDFANYPFYEMEPEKGYGFIFEKLHELMDTKCHFLYILDESGNSLILENMRIDIENVKENLDDSLLTKIQNPESSLILCDSHKILNTLADIEHFINIPLTIHDNQFTGIILTGPIFDLTIDPKKSPLFTAFSRAAGVAVKTLKSVSTYKEKIKTLNNQSIKSQYMPGSSFEVNKFIELLLEFSLTATKAEAGFVAITDEAQKTMKVRASKNLPAGFLDNLDLSSKNGLFEWSPDTSDLLILKDDDFIAKFGIKSIIAVPLVAGQRLIGVFSLSSLNKKEMYTEFNLSILTNFTEQIKLILNNIKLFQHFTQRYLSTLMAMSKAYDFRSPWTAGHSNRVANVAAEIAQVLKLSPNYVAHIKAAGKVHDVGMCGVADIDDNYQADYNHPTIGATMIEVLPVAAEITEAVRSHHEWFDGWGFPLGLKGIQIPLAARILAVAEFFAESTSNNSAKKALTWKALIAEIKLRRGAQFDPNITDALYLNLYNKREKAGTKQIEQCWSFKGEPDNVCSKCPAFHKQNPCWIYMNNQCANHGDAHCDSCFIYKEWLHRIITLKNENKIKVKRMEHSLIQKKDISIVRLKGEIDVTIAPELRNFFKRNIDNGNIKIVIDLENVDFIDSSGLGIFVVAFKAAKAKNGNITFANVKPQVRKVIELTRLDKHLEIFESVEDAENALNK